MREVKTKTALFPGCSLEGTAASFEASLSQVLGVLGCQCDTLRDWNCCGATSAHALDRRLYLSLNLRNLAMAEEQGYNDLVAPCAACYHRLARANHELVEDAELRSALNAETGLKYQGKVAVRNILDYLVNSIGLTKLLESVTARLSGLRVACYYGCLNTRLPHMTPFDDREYPMAMDHIVAGLGAAPLDWSYKTECCGAGLFVTAPEMSSKLVGKILRDAVACGADCIAVACPMCQNNLDAKQEEVRAAHNIERPVPIVFITQLMGLAYGIDERTLKLGQMFVPLQAAAK